MQFNPDKKKFFVIIVLFFLLNAQLSAVGWPQKKGRAWFKLSTQITVADEFYEPGGHKVPITTLGDYTTSLYGEYGITDGLTVFAYIPFFKRITLNRLEGETSGMEFFPGDEVNGFADSDVGLRYRLAGLGATVISGTFLLGLPLGNDNQKNGLYTGDGEMNRMLALEVGHSFHPAAMFATLTLGFNNRVNGYSDEIRYGFELGYSPGARWLLIFRAGGIEPLRNGVDETKGGSGGLFANNQQYLSFGPEINYRITEQVGISLSATSATHAENVVSAVSYGVGVFYSY